METFSGIGYPRSTWKMAVKTDRKYLNAAKDAAAVRLCFHRPLFVYLFVCL